MLPPPAARNRQLPSCCAARFLTGKEQVAVHGPRDGDLWRRGLWFCSIQRQLRTMQRISVSTGRINSSQDFVINAYFFIQSLFLKVFINVKVHINFVNRNIHRDLRGEQDLSNTFFELITVIKMKTSNGIVNRSKGIEQQKFIVRTIPCNNISWLIK